MLEWAGVKRAAALAVAALATVLACAPADSDRRIVLITVDSLRTDRIGAFGAPVSLTPELDALARQGTVFEQAFTPAPLTLPALAGLLTGRPPSAVGVWDDDGSVLSTRHPRLAPRLLEAGWSTGAFVNAPFLDEESGLLEGFLRVRAPTRHDEITAESDAGDLFADASQFLEAHRRLPTFIWIHVFDTHYPYRGRGVGGSGVARYDAAIGAIDRVLGAFHARLREAGLESGTTFVIAADHGEALGEGGERTHGLFLNDATVRVPLLIRRPGDAAGRDAGPASLLDVAPTIAALAGLAWPAGGPLDGVALVGRLDRSAGGETNRPILIETMVPRFEFLLAARRELRGAATDSARAALEALPRLPGADGANSDPDLLRAVAAGSSEITSALEAGRTDEAVAAATTLFERVPRAPAAAAFRAAALRSAGRGEEALTAIATAAESAPSADGWAASARALEDAHRPSATAWGHAADLAPERPRFRLRQAEALLEAGDRAGATAAARAALDTDPAAASLNAALGRVLAAAGDHEGALRSYATAVEQAPGSSLYHRRLAQVAAAMGNPVGAETMLREALRIDATDRTLRRDLGDLLAAQGRLADARQEYRASLPAGTTEPELSLGVAECLSRIGQFEAAAADLDALSATGGARAHYVRGQIEIGRNDLARAEEEFLAALRLEGDKASIHYGLARVALLRSDDSAALRHLERVFAADDPLLRRLLRADRLLGAPERSPELRQAVERYFAGGPQGAGS